MVLKIQALQGLSTVVLHWGWKLPPLPQNTSVVVGNLKYWSILVDFCLFSEIGPIQEETQKPTPSIKQS
jgi:hypothetical protein